MTTMTSDLTLIALIEKNKLEIHPVLDENEDKVEYWSIFNCNTGGVWHEDEDLHTAILKSI